MKAKRQSHFAVPKVLTVNLFFLLVLSFLSTPIFSQIEYPDTPAGKRVKDINELFNSGDHAIVEQYVNDNFSAEFKNAFPVEQHVGIILQTHNMFKNLELYKVELSSDYHAKCLLLSKETNQLLSVDLQTEETSPYKINRMGFRPAGTYTPPKEETTPEAESPSGQNDSSRKQISKLNLIDSLDKYIDSLVAEDEFSGTVLVAKDGKPIYTKAVGYADKNFNVPNKLDTKFCLASMNKMFTGTAIIQLVQQGKLSVNDKVGKYLPDYPNEEVRDKVTIHQLLTHTSGMGSYWQEFFQAPRMQEIKTVADYDNLANKNPLLFEPGERFSYSNSGPLVLGLIIEKISGMSYDDYIRKYVTGPAGMNDTDCYDISIPVENLAVGYTTGRMLGQSYSPRRNNLFISPLKGGPAGGGYSTVEDLLKFDIALRSNKLLDEEHFKLMTTGKVDRNGTSMYAYLFMEKYVNGERIIGHSGGAGGVNSNLGMYMNSDYTVAVMSNYDPPAAENIVSKLETLLAQ